MVDFADRNIVLTGFMGTGKSTVGRRLAKRLGFSWVDTDRLIEERHGSIPEIFARAGEAVFRGIERNIATEIAPLTRHVISTGGRMLLDSENIRAFSKNGRIFCLAANPDVLVARLMRSSTPRPLLQKAQPETEIRALLEERRRGYARFAEVRSGDGSPEEVVESLAELVLTPTETPSGRRGVALMGDATTGLEPPVTVVTDPTVAELFGPCLGPVSAVMTSVEPAGSEGSLVFLGGSSVTEHAVPGSVVVPTTRNAMEQAAPPRTRTIIDLAALQTLEFE